MNINKATEQIHEAGFEMYHSFNEGFQHEIFTCNQGEFKGEVIDIWYDWRSGEVKQIDYSAQFKDQIPKFRVGE